MPPSTPRGRLGASAAPALLAALAAPAAAGDLFVVDPAAPAGTFATIQQAVDAAGDGDVVLVRSGTYPGFDVDGKGVAVLADEGAVVLLQGGTRVANVPAGGHVLIAGMTGVGVPSATPFAGPGLSVLGSAGAVRVERCRWTGADNLVEPPDCQGLGGSTAGWDGAHVEGCDDVVLVDCVLRGGAGVQQEGGLGCGEYEHGGDGGDGLELDGSRAAVYHSLAFGGPGRVGGKGGTGGAGVFACDGALLLAASALQGGDGGLSWDGSFPVAGGDGGHGLVLFPCGGPLPTCAAIDLAAAGGVEGDSVYSVPGQPGQAFYGFLPDPVHPGPARAFSSPAPVRESTSVELAFDGEPSDFGFVLIGAGQTALPLPPFQGWLQVTAPVVKAVGSLGAAGATSVALPLGPLPAGEAALIVPLQGVVLSAALEIVLATPRHQVIVAAGA